MAKEILDGKKEAEIPPLHTIVEHRQPVFTKDAEMIEHQIPSAEEDPELAWLMHPITEQEVKEHKVPANSVPGLDNITAKEWGAVPISMRTLLFNIVLEVGQFSTEMLTSRTVFVPKKKPGPWRLSSD